MSRNFTAIINSLINKEDVLFDDMQQAMHQIMSGEINPIQIAGFMVALQAKGPIVDEITAAAGVMREASNKVNISQK